ncbi:hypothetical protein ACTQXG_11860 [Parabacteroides distasonis]|uniref:hypothetical protein n=1 Tax=Parabacteroides distasonis TaxID=823 RepID=UPI003F9D2CAF
MTTSISYINLSWAVVGIIDKDVNNSLQSMKRSSEPIEVTIERYVVGYLVFWHIAYISRHSINKETFQRLFERLPQKFSSSKYFDDVRDKLKYI